MEKLSQWQRLAMRGVDEMQKAEQDPLTKLGQGENIHEKELSEVRQNTHDVAISEDWNTRQFVKLASIPCHHRRLAERSRMFCRSWLRLPTRYEHFYG